MLTHSIPQSITLTLILIMCITILINCESDTKKGSDENEGNMIYFEGGEITIGTNEGELHEGPQFKTTIESFYMGAHLVTVKEFRKFIEATGYITDAEKFGDSGVFDSNSGWELRKGANWEFPFGEDGKKAKDDHPVTQVSWNDANAYSEWLGHRLPKEIEWEYAAKNGRDDSGQYSWGDELVVNGNYMANVWQGNFPYNNEVKDGYEYTSPVGIFGKTEGGLFDMGGNVWEWCKDTYKMYEGNSQSLDINPDIKVLRGGSFLCDKNVCHGYRVTARSHNSRDTGSIHMGFRTAKDAN